MLQAIHLNYKKKFIKLTLHTPGTPSNAIVIAEKKFTGITKPTKLPTKFNTNSSKNAKARRNQKIDNHSSKTFKFPCLHNNKKNSKLQETISIPIHIYSPPNHLKDNICVASYSYFEKYKTKVHYN